MIFSLQDAPCAEISGETNSAMYLSIQTAFERGCRSILISSMGGEESKALDIAEYMIGKEIVITVKSFCNSSCAQYILPVAQKVILKDGSFVSVHANSFGLSRLIQEDATPQILGQNVKRSLQLYFRSHVESSFMVDATNNVVPLCISSQNGVARRVFTRYDAWIPKGRDLKGYGIDVQYGDRYDELAFKRANYFYKDRSRLVFSSSKKPEYNLLDDCHNK